ncbi:calphotin-like isoform X4 [Accipiter gentilis]|uniref:calphotin-like isoform X4 n=1 Tax=Astur gentilis TaxID=8957 RepID=UPI00210FFF5B|nr:calphotin-like isoform X4 [Accipiter gentilis]
MGTSTVQMGPYATAVGPWGRGHRDGAMGTGAVGLAEVSPCSAPARDGCAAQTQCVGGSDAAMSPGLSQLSWEPSPLPFPRVSVSPQGQLGDSPCTPSPGCRCPRGSSPHPASLPFLPAQALGLTGESLLLVPNPAVHRHRRWPRQTGVLCHLAGAQPSQLMLDPPWTPVFLSEKVTLTCQGPGVPGPTDWYVNEQFWQQAGSNHIHITRKIPGSYSLRCRSPGAGLSPSITLGFSNDWLALQVPAWMLLEGDALPLRCRGWKDTHVAEVRFFRERKVLGGLSQGTELLLPSLQLHHSGRYHCQATVGHVLPRWQESALVMVAVQELFTVPVLRLEGPAEPREGTPVALGCLSHLSPLRPLTRLQHLFYQDDMVVGGPQGSPQLQLPAVELSHSGNYSCEVRTESASVRKRSTPVTVTVRSECAGGMGAYQGPAAIPGSPHPSPGPPTPAWIPTSLPRSLPGIPSCLPRSPHSFPGPSPGPHIPPGSFHSFPSPPIPAWVPLISPWGPPIPLQVPPSLPGVAQSFPVVPLCCPGPSTPPLVPLPCLGPSISPWGPLHPSPSVPPFPRSPIPACLLPAGVPVSGVSLVAQPPGGQVAEGDRLVLSCSVAEGTGPLSFSWHRQGSAVPLATGPYYKLRAVRHQDSGRYHCTATNGGTAADSPPLWVTVLVPVAGATITMARMEPVVPAGENLNLSCSVRVGTAPVTFTWLRDGQELDSGPILSLGTVGPAHAGTYQCLATNRLGTHRIFRARSLALALSVTQPRQGGRQQGTAMAVGLSVSLLLLLVVTAAMGWYLRRRCRAAAGKSRSRDPTIPPEPESRQPEPTAPPGEPEDGEVLYTRVLLTERDGGEYGGWGTRRPRVSPPPAQVPEPVSLPGTSPSRSPGGSPRSAPPQEPPVTYAVLPGPHARLRLPSDTYENVP